MISRSDGNKVERVTCADEVRTPNLYVCPWDIYPGNTTENVCEEVMEKLRNLYDLSHVEKNWKISSECALRIIIDELIYDDWEQRVVISVPRINEFFTFT